MSIRTKSGTSNPEISPPDANGGGDDPYFDGASAPKSAVCRRAADDATDSAIARQFSITFVGSKYAGDVAGIETTTWDSLADVLADFQVTKEPDKGRREGFVPSALTCVVECGLEHGKDGRSNGLGYRNADHVLAIELLVLDFERKDEVRDGLVRVKRGVPTEQKNAIVAALNEAHLAYVAHTSSTKPPVGEHRFRVIVPLSRSVARAEHNEFWRACVQKYGRGEADTSCSNLDRYYTLPWKLEGEEHHWVTRGYGHTLDVDAMISEYRSTQPARTPALTTPSAPPPTGARGARLRDVLVCLDRLVQDPEQLESQLQALNIEGKLEVLARLTDRRELVACKLLAPACGHKGACDGLSRDETIASYEPAIAAALRRSHQLASCESLDAYLGRLADKIGSSWDRAHTTNQPRVAAAGRALLAKHTTRVTRADGRDAANAPSDAIAESGEDGNNSTHRAGLTKRARAVLKSQAQRARDLPSELDDASFIVGRYIGAGLLPQMEAVQKLLRAIDQADRNISLARLDAEAIVDAAIERGKSSPIETQGWRAELATNDKGVPITTDGNLLLVFLLHPKLSELLWYNARSLEIVVIAALPWEHAGERRYPRTWSDEDAGYALWWLERETGMTKIRRDMVHSAVLDVAKLDSHDPVYDALSQLLPQGIRELLPAQGTGLLRHPESPGHRPPSTDSERETVKQLRAAACAALEQLPESDRVLDAWTIDHFGVEDTPYTRLTASKTLIGSVARTFEPGEKVDTMLTLTSEDQGVYKSAGIESLASLVPHGYRLLTAIASKDDLINLQGPWIMEIGELKGLQGVSEEAAKSFLTRTDDSFRAPYERAAKSHPRRTIFIGTSNDTQYLSDVSGNRRHWPQRVTRAANGAALHAAAPALWREAVLRYLAGERWWPTGDEDRLTRAAQDDARRRDVWEERLGDILRAPRPERERQQHGQRFRNPAGCIVPDGRLDRERRVLAITTGEALELLGADDEMKNQHRVGRALRALGWRDSRRWQGARLSVWTAPTNWYGADGAQAHSV